jgi:hypothetical protein
VIEPVASTGEAVLANAEPVLEPVAQAAESVVAAADPVIEPVASTGEAVLATAEPVTETVAQAGESVVAVADPVIEPVVSTGEAVLAEPATYTVAQVGETAVAAEKPVIQPAAQASESVLATTEPVGDPLAGTALDVAEPVLTGTGPASEMAASTGQTVLPTAEPATTEVTVGDVHGGWGVTATTPSASVSGQGTDEPSIVAGYGPLDEPTSVLVSPAPEGALDVPPVPLLGEGGPSIAAGDPTQLVPVLATAGLVTLTAVATGKSLCSGNGALVFTNVRLLPCYAGAATQDVVSKAVSAASRVTDPVRSSRVTDPTRSGPAIGRAVDKIREGIDRALDPPSTAVATTGSSLLVRLGMVVGLVYLALLTVWFWATRGPWSSRQRV